MKIAPMILAVLMLSSTVFASVNPKTGNLAITFKEMPIKKSEHELSIARTYNSLSSTKGWIGFGWGTQFETALVAMPDNSIVVQDNGTGRQTTYFGKDFDLVSGVSKIVQAQTNLKKLSHHLSASLARELIKNDEARYLLVREMFLPVDVAQGDVFKSSNCEDGIVVRTAEGYTRSMCDGVVENFDSKGRLIGAREADGYGFDIEFEAGRPTRIVDTNQETIQLEWTPQGYLSGAAHKEKSVAYVHDEKGNLSKSMDELGNEYLYTYDDEHNLTKILCDDSIVCEMDYKNPKSGKVDRVRDQQGSVIAHEYRADPEDPLHTWAQVTQMTHGKTEKTPIKKYKFQQSIQDMDRQKLTDLSIANLSKNTHRIYDKEGRMTRKRDAQGNSLEIVYHPQNGKIILVFAKQMHTEVRYSSKGVMEQILVQAGEEHVTLDYSSEGKLTGLTPDSSESPQAIRAVTLALQNLIELEIG